MIFETGKVYTFKFNSGEELIAKIESAPIAQKYVTVTDPVSVAPAQHGMGLVPSLFTGDPGVSVTINIDNIAMFTETDDSVKMKYIEATTGIKVPEKKILVG